MVVSYNGWPLSPPRTNRTVPGTNVKFTVADGPAGDLLIYVAEQFHRRVEPLDAAADDWGYSLRRNVNNPAVWSCHASATAIDVNALRHPNGRGGTFTKAQYAEIDKILAECQGTVRQLRGYDEMHFEIAGTPAQCAAAVKSLNKGIVKSPATTRPTVKRGSTGEDVKLVQRFLAVVTKDDPGYGTFGPQTELAVRGYQRQQGLVIDGIVGPQTWARILSVLR
jgi:hypothetical protein